MALLGLEALYDSNFAVSILWLALNTIIARKYDAIANANKVIEYHSLTTE